MPATPMHLCWFVDGHRAPAWNTRWEGSTSRTWAGASGFYTDFARALEDAKFDFMMFADGSYLAEAYGNSREAYLKRGANGPKGDPSVILPILASQTSRLGVIPTLSTTEWRPYQLARYLATLDHVSGGRAGWNIVTSSNDLAAQNYGFDAQPPHDVRYDMADEFVEIATKLWDSWEPDAVVLNRETGYYADHTKVHTIDYRGKHFSSRGPSVGSRPVQGRPVLLQAGSSARGRDFAARHADVILGASETVAGLKAYRQDVRARAEAYGRDPDTLKFFFGCQPVLGDSDSLARARAELVDEETEGIFRMRLMTASTHWASDISKLDPDEPLPKDLRTNGHSGMLQAAVDSGKTLRELYGGTRQTGTDQQFVGTPKTVASQIEEVVTEIGGDGLMFLRWSHMDRRYLSEVLDGLIPELQRRGLTRSEYDGPTLRENLTAF